MARLYRYAMFTVSLLIAVALYLGLYYMAPQVILYRQQQASAATKPIRMTFRPVEELTPPPQPTASRVLSTRPGTVSSLVQMPKETLQPQSPLTPGFQDMPGLAKRVGADPIARSHEVQASPELSKRADARIVEIAAEDARAQLNVARRLVRPSPAGLLPDGASPVLRVEGADLPQPVAVPSLGRSLLTQSPDAPSEAAPKAPPVERAALALAPGPELPAVYMERQPDPGVAEDVRGESTFSFMDDLLDIRLDTCQPDETQPAFFRLRILPRADAKLQPISKKIAFVIDASKSIPQHKLRATCKGVMAAIKQLRAEDEFNVIVFRDSSQLLRPAPEPATDAFKAEAGKFLDGLEARGETDVYQAMEPLVKTTAPEGNPSVLVLLSDGRPTTGLQDGRTIINSLTADNALRHTVYAFGGGKNVNRPLLELLAYRNRGRMRLTDNIDAMEKGVTEFMGTLRDPLLVRCQANFVHIDPAGIYPQNLPDLYAAQPITLYGRYDPKAQERLIVRITGRAGETKKEVVFEANFKEAQSADDTVAKGWAFEKAYYLIGEISRHGETPELMNELRTLSSQYGIKTSYD
jgi:hypothetical protein